MPAKTNSPPIPKLIDDNIASLLSQLKAAKEVKATAEKIEDDLKSKVKDGMLRFQSEFMSNKFLVTNTKQDDDTVWDLNLAESAGNPIIKSDKLLERGVDPTIIAFATSRTPYVQVLLKRVGEKEKK